MIKNCTKCHTIKDLNEFCKDKRKKDGRSSHCKICHNKITRQYRETEEGRKKHRKANREYKKTERGREKQRKYRNTEKAREKQREYQNNSERTKFKRRERKLKNKFNLTIEDYDQILDGQKGVCAICREPERAITKYGFIKRLAVDHNHKTGKIRGLLCTRCNVKIGVLENKSWRLLAEKYLLSSLTSE